MSKRTKNRNVGIGVEPDLKELSKTSPGLRDILRQMDSESAKPKKEKADFVRVQLDFPFSRIQDLNQAMEDAGLETRKDLFNNALTLFVWAVGEKMKGHRLFSIDDKDAQKELVMLPLEHAATKAQRSRAGAPPSDTGLGDDGDGDDGGGGGDEEEEDDQ